MSNIRKNYTNENILHVKNGDLEYIQFKILNKYGLKHCITLKHGGVSRGIYDSLNFSLSGNDLKENVIKNLNKVTNSLGIDSQNVYKATQAHTDNILCLNNENKEAYKFAVGNKRDENYDAYIVSEKNIATLVTTADCNPIIIYDPKKNIVANIHSGWKGTTKKIYLKTCEKMITEFSCNPNDLIVCIGPSIRKCCFSSEEQEFKNIFTNIWENEKEYITYEENSNRFHIDLVYLIKKDFEKIGVKNIVIADICTVCNSNDFFSYRVSRKNNQNGYGLMATITML